MARLERQGRVGWRTIQAIAHLLPTAAPGAQVIEAKEILIAVVLDPNPAGPRHAEDRLDLGRGGIAAGRILILGPARGGLGRPQLGI